MKKQLLLDMLWQPDEESCGPTCLHSVYRYYGENWSLAEISAAVPRLDTGGTLAVMLGCDALTRGFRALIYTYNLLVYDPTWFAEGANINLEEKLAAQSASRNDGRLRVASEAYRRFVQLGGTIRMADLTSKLIRRYLDADIPIIAGLSATWLYRSCRERHGTVIDDDIGGVPAGHFTVLSGYDRKERTVTVADPYMSNPSRTAIYHVAIDRLVCAILLGIVTYDANLLIIEPKRRKSE